MTKKLHEGVKTVVTYMNSYSIYKETVITKKK